MAPASGGPCSFPPCQSLGNGARQTPRSHLLPHCRAGIVTSASMAGLIAAFKALPLWFLQGWRQVTFQHAWAG